MARVSQALAWKRVVGASVRRLGWIGSGAAARRRHALVRSELQRRHDGRHAAPVHWPLGDAAEWRGHVASSTAI